MIKSGKSIAVGGTIYILINFSLGLLYGFITGFSFLEVLVLAGVITISSSAIVAKVLVDLKRTANPETELILGIIMFEDIFLAVYLSVVSGLVLGDATSVGSALLSILIAFGYMLLFFIAARKLPPLLNKLLDIRSNEVFIIVIFAALFFIAGFSETIHVAEAIGALLLGLVFLKQSIPIGLSTLSFRFATSSARCSFSASASASIRFHSAKRSGLRWEQ